jgi:hypothetical protein
MEFQDQRGYPIPGRLVGSDRQLAKTVPFIRILPHFSDPKHRLRHIPAAFFRFYIGRGLCFIGKQKIFRFSKPILFLIRGSGSHPQKGPSEEKKLNLP